ncbi:MAG: hypothetical protein EZS28_032364 [Streblomastix strix]|uniref:Uncharacterized protein n=1 Tax=Streblomastix strix TaxID=222440 RepID=A0A5J4UPX3_9EUKA|nr:MAG: hypothetical protein EZS28_032364 [Streblomastix strix]
MMWEKNKNKNFKSRVFFDIPSRKNCEIALDDKMLLTHSNQEGDIEMNKEGKVIQTRALAKDDKILFTTLECINTGNLDVAKLLF